MDIQIRIKRTIQEDAYISIPWTEAIMSKKADGTLELDTEKLVALAVETGNKPDVEWKQENLVINPHPIQCPKPDERKIFIDCQ
jgi:hypothetical protein